MPKCAVLPLAIARNGMEVHMAASHEKVPEFG